MFMKNYFVIFVDQFYCNDFNLSMQIIIMKQSNAVAVFEY